MTRDEFRQLINGQFEAAFPQVHKWMCNRRCRTCGGGQADCLECNGRDKSQETMLVWFDLFQALDKADAAAAITQGLASGEFPEQFQGYGPWLAGLARRIEFDRQPKDEQRTWGLPETRPPEGDRMTQEQIREVMKIHKTNRSQWA